MSREKTFLTMKRINSDIVLDRGGSIEEVIASSQNQYKSARGSVTLTCTLNNSYLIYKGYMDGTVRKASSGEFSKGTLRKKSAYINHFLGENFGKQLLEQGIFTVDLIIQGFGRGRDGVLSGLRKCGLQFRVVKQCAAQPHNGCRPPKIRRL